MSRTSTPKRAAASRAPATTAAIPSASGSPRRHVEQRPPADLDVADPVGGLRLDQLERDPLERLGVLHQRDRQVERAQQLGLRGAERRRSERVVHPGERRRGVDATRPCQLERRVDAQRAVEMEVQLGLGHRLDEPAAAGAAARPLAAAVPVGSGGVAILRW